MRAFASKTFALNAVDDDGNTYRELLEGLVERTRNTEKLAEHMEELACPPIPPATIHIWLAFNRLRRRKGSNGFSMSPIEWPDIDAFVRNSQQKLTPWEIEVIEELDDLFLEELAKTKK